MLPLAALILAPLLLGRYTVSLGTEFDQIDFQTGNRYTYKSSGCFSRQEQSGTFSIAGNELILDPPLTENKFPHLTIVPWADRIYLVPRCDLPNFSAAYRRGWRGKNSALEVSYLRDGEDQTSPASPKAPVLPAPWNRQLAIGLQPQIATLDKTNCTLNVGSDDGIDVGTVFGTQQAFAIVRTVERHRAYCAWGTLDTAKFPGLTPGAKLEVATPAEALLVQLLERANVVDQLKPQTP